MAATASSNGGGGPPGTQNPNSGSGTPNPDNPKIPPLALTVEQLQVLLRQHAAFAGLERDNVHLQELLQVSNNQHTQLHKHLETMQSENSKTNSMIITFADNENKGKC